MSACLIIQYKDKVYVGSDTALTTKIGEKFFRIRDESEKIYRYSNSLVFCSGDMRYVDLVVRYLDTLKEINPIDISHFLKNNIKKNESGAIFNIEIVVFILSKDHPKIFQISEYNNFEIIEHQFSYDGIKVLACGIKTNDCLKISHEEILKTSDIKQIFKNTFDKLSCNQIGGNLQLWEVGNDIKKILSSSIHENKIDFLPKSLLVHSIVADVIVGNLIAGNELKIMNDANTFVVDGGGATLTNAIFNLTTTNGNSQILLDPQDGIRLRGIDTNPLSPTTGSIINKLWLDANGNLNIIGNANIEGSIIARDGYIGGWRIESNGLYDTLGNYIRSDGNIRLGVLTITGTTGIFDGNFYARNLHEGDYFTGGAFGYPSQVRFLNADYIVAGTMSADRIFGGVIKWPGAEIGQTGTAVPFINGYDYLDIMCNGGSYGAIGIRPSDLTIFHPNTVKIQSGWSGNGNINISGNIYTRNKKAQTTSAVTIGKTLEFTNGILTNYSYNNSSGGTGTNSGDFSFAFSIGDALYLVTTGSYGFFVAPYNCKIYTSTLLLNVSTYAQVQLRLGSYAQFPSYGAAFTTSAVYSYKGQQTYSSGISVTKGDVLTCYVSNNYGASMMSLTLQGTKS